MKEWPGAVSNDFMCQMGQILHRGNDEARRVVDIIFDEAAEEVPWLSDSTDRWKGTNKDESNLGKRRSVPAQRLTY